MKPKRIVFTGGSSLLAVNWASFHNQSCEAVLGLHTRRIRPRFARTIVLNLESTKTLVSQLQDLQPDMVVNTAAITNVEYCEDNPSEAYLVNVEYAKNVAKVCQQLNISLVHMSTDHLFSGQTMFAAETSQPEPQNVYARTKAQAEIEVSAYCRKALIVRSNFYGWGTSYRSSLADQILNSLTVGRHYGAFTDVFFTPILATDLSNAILQLLDMGAHGIFNIASDQRISKYEFSTMLAKIFGLPLSLVYRDSIDDRIMLVKRPKDMSLSNSKARRWLCRDLGSVDEGLYRLLSQQLHGIKKELSSL